MPDRSIVVVGAQTHLVDTNQFRWASNNVSNSLHAPKPLITMTYEAVNDVDAAPRPETYIPKTIVVPDTPWAEWNYTETLQDEGVSIHHDQYGIAIYKFVVGDVVDLVLQNTRALNGVAELHSWHFHGHSMFVVGQGYGTFDPFTDPQYYNLENPILRDTISVWPLGWTAVRFRADNVGAWAFHCAMTPHAVMGMGFNVITSPDSLKAPPPGLESCFQTSVNPDDAQVCMLANDVEEMGDETVTVSPTDMPNATQEVLTAPPLNETSESDDSMTIVDEDIVGNDATQSTTDEEESSATSDCMPVFTAITICVCFWSLLM